jgi:hypothetical protein
MAALGLKPFTALIALEVVVAHYPNLIDISSPTHRTLPIRYGTHVDSPFAILAVHPTHLDIACAIQ